MPSGVGDYASPQPTIFSSVHQHHADTIDVTTKGCQVSTLAVFLCLSFRRSFQLSAHPQTMTYRDAWVSVANCYKIPCFDASHLFRTMHFILFFKTIFRIACPPPCRHPLNARSHCPVPSPFSARNCLQNDTFYHSEKKRAYIDVRPSRHPFESKTFVDYLIIHT